MNRKLACSEFVKRQTKESGYSHFDGTWEELEDIVLRCMSDPNNVIPGYKDGVILVKVPASGFAKKQYRFYSGVVSLSDRSIIYADYSPRRLGEDSFIRCNTKADKQIAKHVEIVCYRADILAEDNDRSGDADWEIVCIKARVSDEEEPMDPYTMARNFLHMKGGTKGDFTAEQFAKSIVYWNNHCMCAGKRSWWSTFKSWYWKSRIPVWLILLTDEIVNSFADTHSWRI